MSDPIGDAPAAEIGEPYWHVHAQCTATLESEHAPTFEEAIAAAHRVVDLALLDGGWMLPPQVPVEVHALLARLEEAWLKGKIYHYEFHEGPMLFVWVAKVEGGPCRLCEQDREMRRRWAERGFLSALFGRPKRHDRAKS